MRSAVLARFFESHRSSSRYSRSAAPNFSMDLLPSRHRTTTLRCPRIFYSIFGVAAVTFAISRASAARSAAHVLTTPPILLATRRAVLATPLLHFLSPALTPSTRARLAASHPSFSIVLSPSRHRTAALHHPRERWRAAPPSKLCMDSSLSRPTRSAIPALFFSIFRVPAVTFARQLR
ncbi:hypothetical protein C8J57DRAFT_131769 [Mycena rebaudengoi]|nr:hypothetical protein C8J57DRAFT_131769 [Mycena rebaudengoi]